MRKVNPEPAVNGSVDPWQNAHLRAIHTLLTPKPDGRCRRRSLALFLPSTTSTSAGRPRTLARLNRHARPGAPQIRSKYLTLSQSVTASLKAWISNRAVCT